MGKIREVLNEINAYDMKWFDEIGGNLALSELNKMEERLKKISEIILEVYPVMFTYVDDVQALKELATIIKNNTGKISILK